MPPSKHFTWVTKTVRKRRDMADQQFKLEFGERNWDGMPPDDPDRALASFESTLQEITDRCFPLMWSRRRSNEDPWITNGIRRRARRKRRLYRRRGRNRTWRRADAAVQAEINAKKQEFIEKLIQDPGKSYYRAVKQLGTPGKGKEWSVRDLFPGAEAVEVGTEILDYFSGVGGDGQASDIPTDDRPEPRTAGLGHFDAERVTKLLKDHKRVKSMVDGDPLPHLIRKFPEIFATPVSNIFNAVNTTGRWPAKWKKEHITVIPKNPKPSGLQECRNISCTPFLSKVLEGVLLKKLRQELQADLEQYEGEKGCGAEHMIIELWDRILEVMDDGDTAACLLGLDFEKAFNRMDHGHCIRQLRRLGASAESIRLVRSFLEERQMAVTIDGVFCGTRQILRGSPQGSVLGCLLYCVTTQNLADRRPGTPGRMEIRATSTPPGAAAPDFNDVRLPNPTCPTRFFPGSDSEDSSEFNFWDRLSGDEAAGEFSWEVSYDENGVVTFKYIDDTTAFEAVPLSTSTKHFTSGPTAESVQPLGLADTLETVAGNAEDIGMRVNVKKTQLLCISPSNGCLTSAVIQAGGETIRSSTTMNWSASRSGPAPPPKPMCTASGRSTGGRFGSSFT